MLLGLNASPAQTRLLSPEERTMERESTPLRLDVVDLTKKGFTWKGWVALAVFTLQNALSALYGQYVLQNRPRCNARVMVLMQELAIKLPLSLLLYAVEKRGVVPMLQSLATDARERPRVWLRMGFPAVCYTVGAILQMIGGANLDASAGQVTFQSKILFTAACSVALLGTRLSRMQLAALLLLSCGVVLADVGPALLHHHGGAVAEHSASFKRSTPLPALRPMHPKVGVAAWLGAALCSALASVYFEKMVKRSTPVDEPAPSLWLRNIQVRCLPPPQPNAYLPTTCSGDVALARCLPYLSPASSSAAYHPPPAARHPAVHLLLPDGRRPRRCRVGRRRDGATRAAAQLRRVRVALHLARGHGRHDHRSRHQARRQHSARLRLGPRPHPHLVGLTPAVRVCLHARVRLRHVHGRRVHLLVQRQGAGPAQRLPRPCDGRGAPNARLPRVPIALN
eukprot:Transcript_2027.p1 GENE.Transcript_2027~~Transcript_2027.p1  ORF type:complete len:480 (+),score=98.72 Transcript_2027:84-1442(+)